MNAEDPYGWLEKLGFKQEAIEKVRSNPVMNRLISFIPGETPHAMMTKFYGEVSFSGLAKIAPTILLL